ncbi:DUF3139 domain-containing protein [Domibacillus sp. PGB-M46]|uniref:DUF3139 domain-containing protein n=1 Tax=Domibacillus sp. PGB-M46 TaxID=2910255 RepID=UPI001F5808AB|nr:DUF3139 domain-containing protein [Domibacillus sp. PGB-M46]MCI2252812.1 DUF3139 domain-containing protein [Domibacillus sp. PGB-M46]
MKRFKITILLLIFTIGSTLYWYIEYPAHEKLAETRINEYMKVQGIDKSKVWKKRSYRDSKQGRWEISYKFKDEKKIRYQYMYDKSQDRVLLFVFDDPRMNGGRTISRGMNHPPLVEGWTVFDQTGKIFTP